MTRISVSVGFITVDFSQKTVVMGWETLSLSVLKVNYVVVIYIHHYIHLDVLVPDEVSNEFQLYQMGCWHVLLPCHPRAYLWRRRRRRVGGGAGGQRRWGCAQCGVSQEEWQFFLLMSWHTCMLTFYWRWTSLRIFCTCTQSIYSSMCRICIFYLLNNLIYWAPITNLTASSVLYA